MNDYQGNRWSKKLTLARLAEQKAQQLFQDIAILLDWLKNDILALAGPDYHCRSELWDFIVAELKQREDSCLHRIRPFRTALFNQKKIYWLLLLFWMKNLAISPNVLILPCI